MKTMDDCASGPRVAGTREVVVKAYQMRDELAFECCLNELIFRAEQVKAERDQLRVAAKELLSVDDDWHGSVNSRMAKARSYVRALLREDAK